MRENMRESDDWVQWVTFYLVVGKNFSFVRHETIGNSLYIYSANYSPLRNRNGDTLFSTNKVTHSELAQSCAKQSTNHNTS